MDTSRVKAKQTDCPDDIKRNSDLNTSILTKAKPFLICMVLVCVCDDVFLGLVGNTN